MPVSIFGREYKTVAERLDELFKSGEKYSLNTEIISWEKGIVIMKATLQIGENTYTGHAYEVEGSSQINNTSALENCETSCIGRSLSSAGRGGSEFASADELANALGQQRANQGVSTPQNQTSGNTTFTGTANVSWSEESRTSKITFGKHKGMRWSELSFNYIEWVATKSSLGDEFKDFASSELEHRNDEIVELKTELVVGKVVGVDDPVAYDKAVEKNRQEMVDKAKAKNRNSPAKKVSTKKKDISSYAEKVVAKLEQKSEEEDTKPTQKAKVPKPEPKEEQLSWDETEGSEKLLEKLLGD